MKSLPFIFSHRRSHAPHLLEPYYFTAPMPKVRSPSLPSLRRYDLFVFHPPPRATTSLVHTSKRPPFTFKEKRGLRPPFLETLTLTPPTRPGDLPSPPNLGSPGSDATHPGGTHRDRRRPSYPAVPEPPFLCRSQSRQDSSSSTSMRTKFVEEGLSFFTSRPTRRSCGVRVAPLVARPLRALSGLYPRARAWGLLFAPE